MRFQKTERNAAKIRRLEAACRGVEPGWMEPLEGRVLLSGTIFVNASATGANNGSTWTDAYTSLQSALNAATSGTTIEVAKGDYSPGANATDTFRLIDGVTLQGGYLSGGSTPSPSVNVTKLDGNDVNYHVVTGSGTNSTAVLNGFTITGGNADAGGDSNSGYGGGMIDVSGSPTITACTFVGNTANSIDGGGGMANISSSPTVTNCTFSGNTAIDQGNGGGMYNFNASSPSLTGCTFSGNTANGAGGGMDNADSSSPTLSQCNFVGNTATGTLGGGGMYNSDSSPALTDCTFSGNPSESSGGGMGNDSSSPSLTNCTFSKNTATDGAGLINQNSSAPTLINCTFIGNTASSAGGGIYDDSTSSPTLINCTFNGNSGGAGGAMENASSSAPTLTNCVLYGDTGEISGGSPAVTFSDIQGGFTGTGNINADPRFVDTAEGDLELQPGSPAINTGSNAALPGGDTTDLAGNPRIFGGTVDMGAYESEGALSVQGTAGNDTISVSSNGTQLTATVNGQNSGPYLLSQITSISIFGQSGNDNIAIGANVPAVLVKGGRGNDTIIASNDVGDTLNGGAQSDSIVGGNGDDSIYGSYGNDTLIGGVGHDTLVSGNGNNKLEGGLGSDSLVGGSGADLLIGNRGPDTLVAGTGDNTLKGNIGLDELHGGTGHDLLNGGPDADTIYTVASSDTVVPDPLDTVIDIT
jgi:parallel beta-helix repeat protein